MHELRNGVWNYTRSNAPTVVPMLLRNELLRSLKNDRFGNGIAKECLSECIGVFFPSGTYYFSKLSKVLLRSLANDIRLLIPGIEKLCQFRLRDQLALGILKVKPFPLSLRQ